MESIVRKKSSAGISSTAAIRLQSLPQCLQYVLVPKDHRRILFRGKLDSLQALFVLNQCLLAEMGGQEKII